MAPPITQAQIDKHCSLDICAGDGYSFSYRLLGSPESLGTLPPPMVTMVHSTDNLLLRIVLLLGDKTPLSCDSNIHNGSPQVLPTFKCLAYF